jgi:aldehyde reductase
MNVKDKRVLIGAGVAVGAVAIAATWWFLANKKKPSSKKDEAPAAKPKTEEATKPNKEQWDINSTVTLSNGVKMPRLGLGTWKAGKGEVAAAVKAALLHGYRLIDGAWAYRNEAEVGEGIKAAIAESNGKVTRESIFVTTKLWNQFHKPDQVEVGCRDSLKNLGLDYIDLYLMHWPVAFEYNPDDFLSKKADGTSDVIQVPIVDTWKAMEALVEKGLVKSIGISNLTQSQIDEIFAIAKIKPVNHQCEAHPHFPNLEIAEYSRKKGMSFTAYSSLGRVWEDQESCLDEPVVKKIADKHKKTAAQVLLRWGLQNDYLIIPKSANPKRLVENSNLFDFELTEEDMKAITALGNGRKRKCHPGWATHFN